MTPWAAYAFGITLLAGLFASLAAARIVVLRAPYVATASGNGYYSPALLLISAYFALWIGGAHKIFYFLVATITLAALVFTSLCLSRRRPALLTRFLSSLTPLNRRLISEFDGLIWTKRAWGSTTVRVEAHFTAYIPGDELSLDQKFVWKQKPLKDSSPEELEVDASSHNPDVRRHAGKHWNSPTPLLARLSRDTDPQVRAGVAMNLECPAEILIELASDPDEEVRAWVARNTNTPEESLRALTRDASVRVQMFCLRNPHLPADCVDAMSENPVEHVRALACTHPNISTAALQALADRWNMKDFEYPVSKWAKKRAKGRRRRDPYGLASATQ